MHETTLVRELLVQVKQVMVDNSIERVTTIRIEVGPLAGVDPLLVEQAYFLLVQRTEFERTHLMVDQPALMAVCHDCQRQFEVVDFKFLCPGCLSHSVQVISGDQVRLLDITAGCHESELIPSGVIKE
ncbi:MAG: hydrogenase maturation nickel metallochaperone HypA [Pirellulaceae bacterium]|nr:hydrogenase maturation nickel metallochaperone HypA [Pirellulaceae bacterium]